MQALNRVEEPFNLLLCNCTFLTYEISKGVGWDRSYRLITDYVSSTKEGNVFSRVCPEGGR